MIPTTSWGRGKSLQITGDEQLTFRRKTPWPDGTTHLLLSPFGTGTLCPNGGSMRLIAALTDERLQGQ
jgi:hypothetical protein